MASLSPPLPFSFFLLLFSITTSTTTTTTLHSICQSTPYPSSCLTSIRNSSSSLSLHLPSSSSSSSSSLLSFALRSLHSAISAATSLSFLLSSASHHHLLPSPALQDCLDLHSLTLSSLSLSSSLLQSSSSSPSTTLPSVRANLAAALTNKATCLDSLSSSSPSPLLSSLSAAYELVSNSLSLLPRPPRPRGRRLAGFPAWLSKRARKMLQYDGVGGYVGVTVTVTVAKDGSGNFTTVGEAIGFAPNNSNERIVIMVRAGVYEENVEVASYKTNIVMVGEGSDVTIITGNRSVGNGWTTFRSATVAVSGQGFLARDLTFQNTAGPAKGQAVALRMNADLTAVYRCIIDGYQDTLYVHSFRQFYRECDVYGTVDFIFGNAAVVFQACNLIAKRPLLGQSNVITAQSRDDPNEDTGISIQNCTIVASDELANSNVSIRTYLGRPWRNYSRTVYIESYIDGLVDRSGWTPWPGNQGLDTLYYGEYMNVGPGATTGGRVIWPGYHVMSYDQASNFSVSQFIYGNQWLDSTSFPYDDGI